MKSRAKMWLDRLGIDAVPDGRCEALGLIIRRHLQKVPFENLTVLSGHCPELDRKALTEKILTGRRGGYCFELNGLLRHGLEVLGYKVQPLLARVLWQRAEPGPRTHFVLKVDLDGSSWLVDAGFGGPCPDVPVPLGTGATFPEPFSLSREPGLGMLLSRRMSDGRSAPIYAFGDELVGQGDIEAANWLAATYPQSIFRTRVMAAIGDSASRRTLDGSRYTRVDAGETVETRALETSAELAACLTDDFGLALTERERKAVASAAGLAPQAGPTVRTRTGRTT